MRDRAGRRRAGGAELVDTSPEPERVPSEQPEPRGFEHGPAPARLVDEPEDVRRVVARVEVQQDEIGSVRLDRERGEDPVVPDPGTPDAEVEDLEVRAGTERAEALFEERHHRGGVGNEAEREGVAEGQDADAARRLRGGELHVVQPERVVPVVEPVPVRDDLRGLRGEVRLERGERFRLARPRGDREVPDPGAPSRGEPDQPFPDGERRPLI